MFADSFVMWDRLRDAPETARVDLGVTVTTLVVYVLSRSRLAWRGGRRGS